MKNENKSFPTFQEQYNKIVGAYMRNELEHINRCACFVGNLLNNDGTWFQGKVFNGIVTKDYEKYKQAALSIHKQSQGLYTVEEIISIECAFMKTCAWAPGNTEERLYTAMGTTLIALRRLHELKGETVSDYQFTKRLSPSF